MVDQASVNDGGWSAAQPYQRQPSAAAGVRNGVGELLHDVVSLAELQTQLLAVDARESAQKARAPIVLVGAGASLALGAIPILLLALGMSLAIAPLTTLVLTSVESDRAGAASGVNSAVSRAGSLVAIALLGGVLQQGGPQLFAGFQMAMALAAVGSVLATFAVFIIEPGPHVDFVPRD